MNVGTELACPRMNGYNSELVVPSKMHLHSCSSLLGGHSRVLKHFSQKEQHRVRCKDVCERAW